MWQGCVCMCTDEGCICVAVWAPPWQKKRFANYNQHPSEARLTSLTDKRLNASLNYFLFFLSLFSSPHLPKPNTSTLVPFPLPLPKPCPTFSSSSSSTSSLSLNLLLLQLVGGEFDLEMNFIIQEAESISCMVELLSHCEVTCQAEIWSMFTAILRKSVRNLQTSTEVGLIQQVLLKMSTVDDMIAGEQRTEETVQPWALYTSKYKWLMTEIKQDLWLKSHDDLASTTCTLFLYNAIHWQGVFKGKR